MIIDASALIAMIQNEPGAGRVESVIHDCSISSVNWSEVVQKLMKYDPLAANIRQDLEAVGLKIVPFNADQAEGCAALWEPCRNFGISLADRVCLQLGLMTGELILTADTGWDRLELPGILWEQIR